MPGETGISVKPDAPLVGNPVVQCLVAGYLNIGMMELKEIKSDHQRNFEGSPIGYSFGAFFLSEGDSGDRQKLPGLFDHQLFPSTKKLSIPSGNG